MAYRAKAKTAAAPTTAAAPEAVAEAAAAKQTAPPTSSAAAEQAALSSVGDASIFDGFEAGDDRMNGSCSAVSYDAPDEAAHRHRRAAAAAAAAATAARRRRDRSRSPTRRVPAQLGLALAPFSDMPFLGANDVQSVAGVVFWRAVVGRDRADMSLAGRHVFKMNAAAETSDVELAAAHCGRVIQRLVDRRLCFYVGISRDPGRRWSQHANSSAWARMIIAVEAPHASASSSVEVRTLQSWGEHSLCSNRSGGGETRIAGSPHVVCVLEGSGLMRR